MNNSNQIRVDKNDYRGMYTIPNKVDTSKRCPFQIIEDGIAIWISLLKDIDFDNFIYEATALFHNGKEFTHSWAFDLYNGYGHAKFAPRDIIRNPTLEEMKAIAQTLKTSGFYFNKKTNELKKIEEDLPF